MADTIAYQDIEADEVVARFQRAGTVAIRVPPEHVAACAGVIEMTSAARRRPAGLGQRAARAIRGLYLTCRVVLFHSVLGNLTPLFVLEAPDCLGDPQPDGSCLFTFARAGRGASSMPTRP